MNHEECILLISYLGTSAVMIGCGIPMFRRRVQRNKWFGFRTAATLSSDAIWYPANRAAGRWLIIAGMGTSLVTIAASVLGLTELESVLLITTTLLTGVALCVIAGYSAQKRITHEQSLREPSDTQESPAD